MRLEFFVEKHVMKKHLYHSRMKSNLPQKNLLGRDNGSYGTDSYAMLRLVLHFVRNSKPMAIVFIVMLLLLFHLPLCFLGFVK